MKIVIADDHTLFLDALQTYLEIVNPDVEISKAASFDQALESVETNGRIDLVLLDINMPGMNGLEGLVRMKERFPGLPIVVMSGQAEPSQASECLSRGAAGFIPKDLGGKNMLKALELVLSGQALVPLPALEETDDDYFGRSV